MIYGLEFWQYPDTVRRVQYHLDLLETYAYIYPNIKASSIHLLATIHESACAQFSHVLCIVTRFFLSSAHTTN